MEPCTNTLKVNIWQQVQFISIGTACVKPTEGQSNLSNYPDLEELGGLLMLRLSMRKFFQINNSVSLIQSFTNLVSEIIFSLI